MRTFTSVATLATAALLALSGCGSNGTASDTASSSVSAEASSQAPGLEFTDTWAKATTGDMTGVFGKIKNTTDQTITLVSADSDVSDMNQLHTTAIDSSGTSAMKQVESFEIKPGETLELAPGGNHIMLMGMHCSLPAGTEAHLTLKDSNGKTYEFTAESRDYTGAKEEYAPGEEASSMAGDMSSDMAMDMSSASALPQCK